MTTEQLVLATCSLCGEGGSVRRRPTRWTIEAAAELGKPGVYDVVERCNDEQACRERVELVLEAVWPLDDRTVPAARGMGVGSSDGAAGVGPHGSLGRGAAGSKVAGPAADEDIEWLR